MWQKPKTDWTADDYYNFQDLNRVEENSVAIADILTDYLGDVVTIITKTDRTNKSFEFYDSLNRIEQNLQALAERFYTPVGWEAVKTNWQSGKGGFSWKDANRLEKNLYLLYNLLTMTLESMKYSGTFTCGEETI